MSDVSNVKRVDNAFYERGSWYHRIRTLEDGKTKYSKLGGFETAEEANESYNKYLEEFKKQQRAELTNNKNSNIMFKDYIIYWLENVYSKRVETTTLSIGKYAVYNIIIPSISYDIRLTQVSTAYLDELIGNCAKVVSYGGETSRLIIYMALKDAIRDGYISNNPAKDTIPYPRPKPKITVLNQAQISKLLVEAQKTSWYLEILLALFCGLRKGEILGLKTTDFDLEKGTVTISRQLVRDIIYEKGSAKVISCNRLERPPKTINSNRVIKIPSIVLNEVKKRLEQIEFNKKLNQDKYVDSNYISCNKFGYSHAFSSINTCLENVCKKACVPHITLHGLRHMCATLLLEQGVSLEKISGLLGHSSIHTTFEYYADVMDEKEKIMSYMNDIFSVEEEI